LERSTAIPDEHTPFVPLFSSSWGVDVLESMKQRKRKFMEGLIEHIDGQISLYTTVVETPPG
jgi:hypothetical protein